MREKEFISEVLDNQDLTLIDGYRKTTLMTEDHNYTMANMAPVEKLLEPWAAAKQEYLHRLLGGKAILEKEVCILKDEDELCKNFRNEIGPYTILTNNLFNCIFYKCMVPCNPNVESLYKIDGFNQFFSSATIVSNVYSGEDIVIKNQNNEMLKIQKGIKIIKLYKNLIDFYDLANEEFYNAFFNSKTYTGSEALEILRNAQSVVRNQLYLRGTLCLSIHPLDYMTMSDNANNWSSCMRWQNGGGDYRAGTVEMMNSRYVVVGYLRSNTPFVFYDITRESQECTWNSKKWRCLFIVDKECITSIKDYPFRNPTLTKICIEWLRDLAAKNLDWHYDHDMYAFNANDFNLNDEDNPDNSSCNRHIEFSTDYMYNDFGSTTHYMYIKDPVNSIVQINYSGTMECMICGDTGIDLDGEDSSLVCDDCEYYGRQRCASCGQRLYNEDSIYTFADYDCDNLYCEDCAFDIGFQCPYCGDLLHYKNVYHFYAVNSSAVGTKPIEEIISSNEEYEVFMAEVCQDCAEDFFQHPNRFFAETNYYAEELARSNTKCEAYLIGKNHDTILIAVDDSWRGFRYGYLNFDFFNYKLPDDIYNKVFETSPKKIF